jgi:hypothetical protein
MTLTYFRKEYNLKRNEFVIINFEVMLIVLSECLSYVNYFIRMPLAGLGEFKPPTGTVPDPPPAKKKRRTSNAATVPAQPTPALQDLLPPPLTGNLYFSVFMNLQFLSFTNLRHK